MDNTDLTTPPAEDRTRATLRSAWAITIPLYSPPSKNTTRGRHYRVEHKSKLACATMLAAYAHIAGVPRVREPTYLPRRRVRLTVRLHQNRLPDPTNFADIFLDALKLAQLVVDDSAKWLDFPTPVVEYVKTSREEVTVITIEDLT